MNKSLLSTSGLSLERMHTFLRIAEAGSIAKAAERDPSRQSLYSRQVRELSEFFGTELMRRSGKGIELTSAGRDLAERIRRQFAEMEGFRSACQGAPLEVRIGAGNSVLEWMLAPRLNAEPIQGRQPRYQLLSLRTGEAVEQLREMRLDFAILRQDALVEPLQSKAFGELSYRFYCPKTLLSRKPVRLKTEHLETLPLATSAGGRFRERLEQAAKEAGCALNLTFSCSTFTQAATLALTGKAAAILPDIAGHLFSSKDFHALELPFMKDYRRGLSLAWNPRTVAIRPELQQVIKHL